MKSIGGAMSKPITLDTHEVQRVILKERPSSYATDETFAVEQSILPEVRDGEFMVDIKQLSLAPAMRGWIGATPTYRKPLELGEQMPGRALGEVIKSRHADFAPGDIVVGPFGMVTSGISDGSGVHKCDLTLAQPATWLGVLDVNGLTAYFGLLRVGQMQPGDTVMVSGAAGGVGSVTVQIARLLGAGRVIGVAGGASQCQWLEELGVDVAIDYKNEDVAEAISQAAPEGIDVYFDNVGGPLLDVVLTNLAYRARIVICGAISEYNQSKPSNGPANYRHLLFRSASMTGFTTTDFINDFSKTRSQLARWVREGQIITREYLVSGTLGDFGSAFNRLFGPDKPGKLVLQLAQLRGRT